MIKRPSYSISRRQFLGRAAGVLASLTWPVQALSYSVKNLVASAQRLSMGEVGELDVWAYNQLSPGPELRVKQGDTLKIDLVNQLGQATTIHWHGIRIDNAMDGVGGFTQPEVLPGETFQYQFLLPDAGTYWYHSHANSSEQVGRGLYGLLVVEEPTAYNVDREISLVLDDWRLDDEGEIQNDFWNLRDASHAGRLGNWVTVNSQSQPDLPFSAGERVRIRLLNAANARVLNLYFDSLSPWLISLDGQPIEPEQLIDGRLTIAPAQRADLVVDFKASTEPLPLIYEHSRGTLRIAQFVHDGSSAQSKFTAPPAALPPNPLEKTLDLDNALQVQLEMSGGAMGSMNSASFEGKQLTIRELVKHGMAWSFNGTSGMTDTPLFSVKRGSTVVLQIANDNRWSHAMHLHGHHFKVLKSGSEAEKTGRWRDTVLISPTQSTKIAFVADNPGKWLLHCHMLEHASAGMMTWFEVIG